MVEGRIKRLLQAEGLALFLGALAAYQWLGASWWMFAALCLAPDLSFAAYLLGPRVGLSATISCIALWGRFCSLVFRGGLVLIF
jgi:Domain of unknown function (DUF4260)